MKNLLIAFTVLACSVGYCSCDWILAAMGFRKSPDPEDTKIVSIVIRPTPGDFYPLKGNGIPVEEIIKDFVDQGEFVVDTDFSRVNPGWWAARTIVLRQRFGVFSLRFRTEGELATSIILQGSLKGPKRMFLSRYLFDRGLIEKYFEDDCLLRLIETKLIWQNPDEPRNEQAVDDTDP